MSISLQSERVRRALIIVIVGLVAAGALAQISKYVFSSESALGLVPLFDPSLEGNLPTVVSTALLLACSGLMVGVASVYGAADASAARRWRVLAVLFALAALDEAVALHEKVGLVLDRLGDTGAAEYAWIALGIPLVAVLVFLFGPFLIRLPPELGRPVRAGVGLFLAAALGVELIEASIPDSLVWGFVATIQEAGEMAGAAIITVGLLRWLAVRGWSLRVAFGDPEAPITDAAAVTTPAE